MRASTLRGDLAEEKAKHIHNREGTETKLSICFIDGRVEKILHRHQKEIWPYTTIRMVLEDVLLTRKRHAQE